MIGKKPIITYYNKGVVIDLKPDDIAYHGKKAKHQRTGIIREIVVLVRQQTPSGEALMGKYNPLYHILYDTFMLNNAFYLLLD